MSGIPSPASRFGLHQLDAAAAQPTKLDADPLGPPLAGQQPKKGRREAIDRIALDHNDAVFGGKPPP